MSRFGGAPWGDHFEALYLYYQKKVTVQLDANSSIAALTTRAFSAGAAHGMNRRLLELSEDLVNKLNQRGRQDMVRFAAAEVQEAQNRASAHSLALAGYRNRQGVIDPERQSAIPLQQIARLQDELVETKSQIAMLEKLAKDNPQLPVFRQRAQLLQGEIRAETARVAGAGSRSLADKAAEFQRLSLEKEFADKMLASALSTLEQARSEAQRKQLYLERIVQPSRPDAPMEPRRLQEHSGHARGVADRLGHPQPAGSRASGNTMTSRGAPAAPFARPWQRRRVGGRTCAPRRAWSARC